MAQPFRGKEKCHPAIALGGKKLTSRSRRAPIRENQITLAGRSWTEAEKAHVLILHGWHHPSEWPHEATQSARVTPNFSFARAQ